MTEQQREKQQQIFEWVCDEYPDVAPQGEFDDNYNSCISGVAHYFSGTGGKGERLELLVYDMNLCRQLLIDRDGMSYDEAQEWLDYNDLGAYSGKKTPAFLDRPEGLDEDEGG